MLSVEITPGASAQVERAALWWAEHRPSAPEAIRIDFDEAQILLARQPGIGARSATPRYPDLRRIYLSRVRYHIYYRIVPGKVEVLAFWHASSRKRAGSLSGKMTSNRSFHTDACGAGEFEREATR